MVGPAGGSRQRTRPTTWLRHIGPTLFPCASAIPDLAEAVYFNTSTYATIGANNAAIASGCKLVAAVEGVSGIPLMGWTTVFFVGGWRGWGREGVA